MNRRAMLGAAGGIGAALLLPGVTHGRTRRANAEWRSLFDGKTLDGWRFYQQGTGDTDRDGAVAIENGTLHFLGPRYRGDGSASGHISSIESHGNYHLRLQFRWGERRYVPRMIQRRNSGLLYHMGPATDRLFPVGSPGTELEFAL